MKKKIASVVFTLFFVIQSIYSQSNVIELVHEFDYDFASSIIEKNGNILVGISSRSQNGTDYDILLLELKNKTFKIENETYLGKPQKLEFIKDIVLSQNNEIVIIYSSRIVNQNRFKANIAKLDENNEIIWSLELPSDSLRVDARKILEDNNGNFLVLTSCTFSLFNTTFLHKISPTGELLSTQKFDTFQAFNFDKFTENNYLFDRSDFCWKNKLKRKC